MTAKTMFGDVQLDAKLASILGPYGDKGSQHGQVTGLIPSLYRLRISRSASVTISAALGIALITSTAILFDRVSVELTGLKEETSSPDQALAYATHPQPNSRSAGVVVQLVDLEPKDTRAGEHVSFNRFTRPLRKSRLSRSFAQQDSGIIREKDESRTVREVLPDPAPVPYNTAPANAAIASLGGKVMPLLDAPSPERITGNYSSANVAAEAGNSETSRRIRRDTVDAIRALRRQW